MHEHDRKRRLRVEYRGQRVPNLWKRPKREGDHREGDTYEVTFRDGTGRQRQKTLIARTLQRAIAEAEEYRTQLRKGELVAPSNLRFADVAREYFTLMESLVPTGERSQKTLDLYRQRHRTHIGPVLDRKRIEDVRAEHIATIYEAHRRNGHKQWTIAGTQTTLSAILRFAMVRGYIASNPLDRLSKLEKPRQVSHKEARRLTEDEVRSLCAKATPRYRPLVTTLAWTGLRVSEALALRWGDIDFEEGEIRVGRQLQDDGTTKRPKTKAGTRSVPLLDVVREALKAHRVHQLALGLVRPESLIFCSAQGRSLDRHNVRNKGIVLAAERAGLHGEGKETVTTHDLRRTFISHLILSLKLDPLQVSKIAGHSRPSMTLDVYAEEFDRAMHRDELKARIEAAGFGAAH